MIKRINLRLLQLSLLLLTIVSCNSSEIDDMGNTKWSNSEGSITFEFFDSYCNCMVDIDKQEKEIGYSYEFEKPNIYLYVPASTGYSNYEGTIDGHKMILTPVKPEEQEDETDTQTGVPFATQETFHLK